MGKKMHIVEGGAGMEFTVNMVHRLLSGAHITIAAEALISAAKVRLDVKQLYDIVKGAVGASWMFCDRGKRMIEYICKETNSEQEKMMISFAILIKDMIVVYSSSTKSLKCPVPIATAALQ